MLTLMAFFTLALQDPPRTPEPPRPPEGGERRLRGRDLQDPDGRDRAIKDLERQVEAVQEEIDKTPDGSPERSRKVEMAKRLLAELRQLREQPQRRGAGAPPPLQASPTPEGRQGLRFRPPENPGVIREWLEKNEPETFQRLQSAEQEGRRPEVLEILSQAQGRMEMKRRDPKGYERAVAMQKLDRETMELAEKARRAPAEERDPIAKHLAEALEKLFDLREESRAAELSELKRRVEDLDKELSNRKANKSKIVERRRRELMGERGDLDW